jgi:hypothetical protein
MKLTEHRLQDMSKIEARYFTGPASKKDYLDILVIRYTGSYGYGSDGNGDARYMRAMAMAGTETYRCWGVIHDLRELHYEWGDMLESVFISPHTDELGPVAVVVGPMCEEAVRTLLLGENSTELLEKIGYVFQSLDAAWAYVDAQIE